MKSPVTQTIRFEFPSLKSIGITVLFILIYLGISEIVFQIPWFLQKIPFPSASLSSRYPEIGVKFQRLFQIESIDCLFIGSSMIDAGLDPIIFQKGLDKENGQMNTCFNMGLAGLQTEASTAIATTLTHWHPIRVVIIGLSPLDLSSTFTNKRPIASMPVFTYYNGKPSIEGWMFNHFRFPWYFAALPRSSDHDYLAEQVEWDELLTDRGIRKTGEIGTISVDPQEVTLENFEINPVDMLALESTVKKLKSQGITPIVIEFPVHPNYYPYLVEGGDTEYQKRFITPVKTFMDENNILFIQTQTRISSIVTDADWVNRNHLNITGAEKFTNFILDEIHSSGVVK